MRVIPGFYTTNKILSVLPTEEFSVVRKYLSCSRIVKDQTLTEYGQVAEHAFFIEEGIVSLIAQDEKGTPGVQVAMIGREGMVGALALLGAAEPHACSIVQVPGPVLRISIANLLQCFDECPVLRRRCLEYIQVLTGQIMGTALSNARNTLVQRYVRWLLMAHERMEKDDLPVTHEALSAILGVRRSGVTVATAALQEAGLIRTRRGRIRVLDRLGLEAVATGRAMRPRSVVPKLTGDTEPAMSAGA